MRGVTLLELLVVLTILGLMLAITGLAIGTSRTSAESQQVLELRAGRAAAVRSGVARRQGGVLFLPDGRAIGPSVDPLIGAPNAK